MFESLELDIARFDIIVISISLYRIDGVYMSVTITKHVSL